jgi:hypothetical protein
MKFINIDCEGELYEVMKWECTKYEGAMENTLFYGIKVIGEADEADVEGIISDMYPFAEYMETTLVKNNLLADCRDYDGNALYFGVMVIVYELPDNGKVLINEELRIRN